MKKLLFPVFAFLVFPLAIVGQDLTQAVLAISSHDELPKGLAGAKSDGIQLVIHRASSGIDGIDSSYAHHEEAAASEQLLWGAYHFGRDGEDPISQAQHFIESLIRGRVPGGENDRVLLVLDVEPYGQLRKQPGGQRLMRVGPAAAFVGRVHELTGVYPGIYTTQTVIAQYATMTGDENSRAMKELSRCWLWIANYSNSPTLPATHSPWRAWTLWNYTSDGIKSLRGLNPVFRTELPALGLKGADLSYFAGTREQLLTFFQNNSWDYHLQNPE